MRKPKPGYFFRASRIPRLRTFKEYYVKVAIYREIGKVWHLNGD